MDAKECDRCHKLYSISIKQRVFHLEYNGNRELSLTVEHANAYQTTHKLDLCPDCTKELFDWLDKGEKENELQTK